MTPRQRVLASMRHEEPDRVPLFYRDVPEVRKRLLNDLRLKDFDDLLEHFEIDFRWVEPAYVGPPLENQETGIRRDIWGIEYTYVPFSESAGYWEAFSRPLRNATTAEELESYSWPSFFTIWRATEDFLSVPPIIFRMTFPLKILWPCIRLPGSGLNTRVLTGRAALIERLEKVQMTLSALRGKPCKGRETR